MFDVNEETFLMSKLLAETHMPRSKKEGKVIPLQARCGPDGG